MKFKSIGIKAAVLATVAISSAVVTAAPSHAASITSGGTINIDGVNGSLAKVKLTSGAITGLTFTGPQANQVEVNGATGGFELYRKGVGTIQNLNYFNGAFQPITDFIKIDGLSFNLSSVATTIVPGMIIKPGVKTSSTAIFDFLGTFKNSENDIVGSGKLTTVLDLNSKKQDAPSSFSGTFAAAPVPTPALLPGLVGMGVAALRKRRSEEETVEEAVEV